MKRINRARSSSLFLMELILAILFFSVASAVCVQFFIKSHVLSSDSRILNYAVNECTGIAEMIDTADGIQDCLTLLRNEYPDGTFPDSKDSSDEPGSRDGDAALDRTDVSEAELFFYYDENFSACSEEDSCYTLSLLLSQEDYTLTARMDFTKVSGESVYQLETKYHIARRTSDETR